MKSLLEFKSIVEEEKSDYSKFDVLVRAGLANKAQMQRIHKILDKMSEDRPQFNNADKMIIQNLFNKMVDLVSNNKQINMQARRAVKEDLDEDINVIDTSDFKLSPSGRKVRAHRIKVGDKVDRVEEEYIEIQAHELHEAQNPGPTPPYVLLLKRKAIRLYPDGTKIALYYNKQINKFFSVPYDTPVDTAIQAEEVEQIDENENLTNARKMYHKHFVAAMKAMPSSIVQKRHQDEMEKYKKIMGNSFIDQVAPSKFAKFDKKIKEEVEQINEFQTAADKAKLNIDKVKEQKSKVQALKAMDKTREYESKRLEKYKQTMQQHREKLKEEVEITEAVMDTLHKIVKDKSAQSVKFGSGQTRKVDHYTASALTQVHRALNDENKKKFADMVHKSPEHFMKASDFAFKRAK